MSAAQSLRHPLARALLVLTFTTGLVDAVSFLGLGRVFTANMTGRLPRGMTAQALTWAGYGGQRTVCSTTWPPGGSEPGGRPGGGDASVPSW